MAAVSQALIDFANHHRQPPEAGVVIVETPRYRITLQPDFPIAGPNSVSWIRCKRDESDEVIGEVRSTVAPRLREKLRRGKQGRQLHPAFPSRIIVVCSTNFSQLRHNGAG